MSDNNNPQEDLAMGCANILWIFFLHLPLSILLKGFVIFQYWNWFAIPLGAPIVSFWHVVGFSSLVSVITTSYDNYSWSNVQLRSAQRESLNLKDDLSSLIKNTVFLVVTLLFSLFFGWLYSVMM